MEESECKRFKANIEECPSEDPAPYPQLGEGREQELTKLFDNVASVADAPPTASCLPPTTSCLPLQRVITSSFKHPSMLRAISDKLPSTSSQRKPAHRRTNSSQSVNSTGWQSSFDENAERGMEEDMPEKSASVPNNLDLTHSDDSDALSSLEGLRDADNFVVPATPTSQEHTNWLLRFFQSELFDASLAVHYLYRSKSKDTGVQQYLGEKKQPKKISFFLFFYKIFLMIPFSEIFWIFSEIFWIFSEIFF
jgi:hypothetical protein